MWKNLEFPFSRWLISVVYILIEHKNCGFFFGFSQHSSITNSKILPPVCFSWEDSFCRQSVRKKRGNCNVRAATQFFFFNSGVKMFAIGRNLVAKSNVVKIGKVSTSEGFSLKGQKFAFEQANKKNVTNFNKATLKKYSMRFNSTNVSNFLFGFWALFPTFLHRQNPRLKSN